MNAKNFSAIIKFLSEAEQNSSCAFIPFERLFEK